MYKPRTILKKLGFKSKLKSIKNLDAKNEAYAKLSIADQKREVAYDALTLILGGKLMSTGKYGTDAYWSRYLQNRADACNTSKELQSTLLKLEVDNSCAVCARGALMLSNIRVHNGISPLDTHMSDGNEANCAPFEYDELTEFERFYESTQCPTVAIHTTLSYKKDLRLHVGLVQIVLFGSYINCEENILPAFDVLGIKLVED